ncbi:non-ribosomal peptide synthetase [Nonomuraea deserti]|uniref:Non-ribosomal peptide synthetase n=1 Tax=Nonomuraea deserti TaxID=1848322 RepID=A0A4R4VH77_9ACTN|nr:amino acid adenylation domain-containing protein [Nonomuraea deserti]TDD01524.1 non-ribosomal peptide synthetase [Nonomuraea deserti]
MDNATGSRVAAAQATASWPPCPDGPAGTGRMPVELGGETADALLACAQRLHVSPYSVVAAAYLLMVGRSTGTRTPEIGLRLAGGNRRVAVRVELAGSLSFDQVAGEAEGSIKELTEGGVAAVPAMELTDTPAGSVALTLTVAVPLTEEWDEDGGRVDATLEYDTARLHAGYARLLAERLVTILRQAPRADTLDDIDLLGDRERAALVDTFNRTAVPFTGLADPVHVIIAARARRYAERVAVADGSRTLTYRELDELAGRLAARLAAAGAGPESRIGVRMEHGVALVVALLAVLKAGAAYVPLDPRWPELRASQLVTEAGCDLVLGPAGGAGSGLPHVGVDLDGLAAGPSRSVERAVSPAHLAYVMYTSGSTGRPKGVMISHGALANYVLWSASRYMRHPADEPAAPGGSVVHSSIAFDLTVTSLLTPLVAGHAVRLVDHADPRALPRALNAHPDLELIKLTPSHLRILNREPLAVPAGPRTFVVGGEALTSDLIAPLSTARVFNEYGPTETVVGCCVHEASAREPGAVPIGRPIANTRVYVLDGRMRPCGVGIPGELHVAGAGLARGYAAAPAETAVRFVPDPFSPEPGARMYRTGDLACHVPGGGLRFLGRIDDQVKVRGTRVDPEEIRHVVLDHPSVRDAVVVPLPSEEDVRVVVFAIPGSGAAAEPSAADVLSFVARRLPEAMVPEAVTWVAEFPLTANGKIDTRALGEPAPETVLSNRPADGEPADRAESRMMEIFEQLLQRTGFGTHADFFDLGGHSMLAVRLMARIHKEFGVSLPLGILFDDDARASTVARLAAAVRGGAERREDDLVRLRSGSGRTPLYLVHPAGGEVSHYRALAAELAEGRAVHAFQAPALDLLPEQTVPALAEEYYRHLPEGSPSIVGGWSFGGAVAYELAGLLLEHGRHVDRVVVLDGHLRVPEVPENDSLGQFADEIRRMFDIPDRLDLADLAGVTMEQGVERVFAAARASGRLPETVSHAYLRALFARYRAHVRALAAYRPAPRELAVELVQPRDADHAARKRALRDWQELTGGRVRAHLVDGDHYSMLAGPQVARVAATLDAVLP